MGELKLRGNVWWIRYYRNGQRHEESAKTDKKTKAEQLLKLREGDIAKGVPVTSALSRFTFDQGVELLTNDYIIRNRRTLDITKARIKNHLTPAFGGRRVSSITTADVDAFIVARRTAKASDGEIRLELAALKRILRLAYRGGKLLQVPYITMPPPGPARTGFFEWDQFTAVREKLRDPLGDVAAFAYLTGWRIRSEVLSLTWGQVDVARGTVRLDPGTTKNDEGRLFPYDVLPDLVAVIEARWKAKLALEAKGVICPFVFHRNGRPVKSFRKAWENACEDAGCPGKIPHDFRRTAVRNLVRAGIPEKTAMQLTGHKTRAVFDRYDIVNEADLRTAVAKLAGTKKGQSAKSGTVKRFNKRAK